LIIVIITSQTVNDWHVADVFAHSLLFL